MVTYLYEWKILDCEDPPSPQKQQQTNKIYTSQFIEKS